MAQVLSQNSGEDANPLDESGLCLLSLDGGGVRGLSTLYILKNLMTRLNRERQQKGLSVVKPCEVFDLIGGTSTGGLIAIMLGRLDMDVNECISAYNRLMESVFEGKSHKMPFGWTGRTKARFSTIKLKNAIEQVIAGRRISASEPFNDGNPRRCRVFVCTAAKETTSIIRLRSYDLPEEPEISATVLDAALATSAATTVFDPVTIGSRKFVDGGLGANNPVDEVEGEASNIWSPKECDIRAMVKCFISIGTGCPSNRTIEDKMFKLVSKTLVDIATETEKTERKFIARWGHSFDSKRYFRFNVDQGLQGVGLAEYKTKGQIEAATHDYLGHTQQKFRMRDCIHNLGQKQYKANTVFAAPIHGEWKLLKKYEVLFWGFFWIDAGQLSTAEKDFVAIARKLGSPAESLADAQQVLANTKNSWLLILDNADDPKYDYQYFFPPGNHGAIIMTSRNPECAKYNTVGSERSDQLEAKHSTELLLKAADIPEDEWLARDEQAKAVLDLLQSHTLALIQAGAYIARGHCTLDQYVSVYRMQRSRLLKYRPKQMQSRYGDVYATFEASAEALERLNTQAAMDALDLLNILSMLHYSSIPFQLFEEAWKGSMKIHSNYDLDAGKDIWLGQWHVSQLPEFMNTKANEWDSFHLTGAVSLLTSLSLVHKDASLSISMHPLTHAWAKDRQGPEHCRGSWLIAGCLIAVLRSKSGYWQTGGGQLRPHLLSFINIDIEEAISYSSESAVLPILLECGWALQFMRQDEELRRLLKAITISKMINIAKPSPKWLEVYFLKGTNDKDLQVVREAVDLLESVVEAAGNTLAENHPRHIKFQRNLAAAYIMSGQARKAVLLLEQAVKMSKHTLDENHRDMVRSQRVLASAYCHSGQISEAIRLFERILVIRKIREAIELLEHVVSVQSTLAEIHPDRLASQHDLASAYSSNGQISEAIELLEHVVKIRHTLPENHPDRLVSKYELARAYLDNERISEAIELLEHVVRIRHTLAENHPDRLVSKHELARAYLENGQISKVIELLEQVVGHQSTLVEYHPDRLVSQHVLGKAYWKNGQAQKAIELQRHVVKVRRSALPETHPSRIRSEERLAEYLEAMSPDQVDVRESAYQKGSMKVASTMISSTPSCRPESGTAAWHGRRGL
ncbi:MAG: hypothetical protein Q9160_007289 [Pyrenula sp. 1 TL-2023]